MTLGDIYKTFCDDVLEPGGLVLGILTEAQFIAIANEVLLDFVTETAPAKTFFTQTVFGGQSLYTVPEDILRVDLVFLGGEMLEQTTATDLSARIRNWRTQQRIPDSWRQDGLPPKTIEICPMPNFNSGYIAGPNEPNPPHAQYSLNCTITDPNLGPIVQTPPQHRGLTIYGPTKPPAMTSLNDPIPLILEDVAVAYFGMGILQKVFAGDTELKFSQGAIFSQSNYTEGVNLMKAITGEVEEVQP